MSTMQADIHGKREELRARKFTIVPASLLETGLESLTADRKQFHEEWNELDADRYLAPGETFRRRRFAYFQWRPAAGELTLTPKDTYNQSSRINSYAGDIDRRFEPLSERTIASPYLRALVQRNFQFLPLPATAAATPIETYEVDVHQIRIIGTQDAPGDPTPEGVHRDGEDFVFIHCINRSNTIGGANMVYDPDHQEIARHELLNPMDTMILWDCFVLHRASAIQPEDPSRPAVRDMLLIGFVPLDGQGQRLPTAEWA